MDPNPNLGLVSTFTQSEAVNCNLKNGKRLCTDEEAVPLLIQSLFGWGEGDKKKAAKIAFDLSRHTPWKLFVTGYN